MILKSLIKNCLLVLVVSAAGFIVHYIVLSLFNILTANQLLYAYVINCILACSVIILIILLKKRLKDQLGFVFMAASMLKFVLFYFLFLPEYNSDGEISRLEFFTFFIPYAICLIAEMIILSRFLNSLDDYN